MQLHRHLHLHRHLPHAIYRFVSPNQMTPEKVGKPAYLGAFFIGCSPPFDPLDLIDSEVLNITNISPNNNYRIEPTYPKGLSTTTTNLFHTQFNWDNWKQKPIEGTFDLLNLPDNLREPFEQGINVHPHRAVNGRIFKVHIYKIYELLQNTALPSTLHYVYDNDPVGHGTICITTQSDFKKDDIVKIWSKGYDFEHFVVPELVTLWNEKGWRLRVAAEPKDLESNFDGDSWNTAQLVFDCFHSFSDQDAQLAMSLLNDLERKNYQISDIEVESLKRFRPLLYDLFSILDWENAETICKILKIVNQNL